MCVSVCVCVLVCEVPFNAVVSSHLSMSDWEQASSRSAVVAPASSLTRYRATMAGWALVEADGHPGPCAAEDINRLMMETVHVNPSHLSGQPKRQSEVAGFRGHR